MINLLLPSQCKPIEHKHLKRQQQTGNLSIVQRSTQEAQRATPVHGGTSHIERESSNGGVHQDAKVISEVGTRNAECPHARDDKDITGSEQAIGDVGLVDGFIERLVLEGCEVEMVTEYTQRENNDGEEVAAIVRAAEDACEEVVFVFYKRPRISSTSNNHSGAASGYIPCRATMLQSKGLVWQQHCLVSN